jgi:hypothetical protein
MMPAQCKFNLIPTAGIGPDADIDARVQPAEMSGAMIISAILTVLFLLVEIKIQKPAFSK